MTNSIKLKPGQKGTKKLVTKYGEQLYCVRYRYDATTGVRIKTVELIVEKILWTAPIRRFKDDALVPVRIGYEDTELREQAKAARGRWDPNERVWYIQFGKIKNTDLAKFIVS